MFLKEVTQPKQLSDSLADTRCNLIITTSDLGITYYSYLVDKINALNNAQETDVILMSTNQEVFEIKKDHIEMILRVYKSFIH